MRSKGYVCKHFHPSKKWGLSKDQTGERFFWHHTEIVPGQGELLPLQIGDEISYEVRINPGNDKPYCAQILVTKPFNQETT